MLRLSARYCLALLLVFCSIYTEEKTAVFIIGMGRSGTSCTAGVLHILGLEMGSPLASANEGNKKGKFEHVPTCQFQQHILKELDATWWNPRLINWHSFSRKNELKNEVRNHLQKYFGNFSFFGIKNPGMTTLLPLYIQAAQELGYTPKIILVIRHPDETNASLKKDLLTPDKDYYRNISIAYACALTNAQGCDLHVIYFSDLLARTEQTVARLRNFLPQLKEYTAVKQELEKFIDDGLKHHNTKA